ncbi:MAG: hypothetical protein Fur0015_00560 [Ignavibacteriales bacterium]
MKKLSIIILIGFIFFIGCDKNKDKNRTEPDNNTTDNIMPFKVGNFWNYVDSSFADDGTFLNEDYSKLGISGKETINYKGKQIEMYYWNWYDMNTYEPRESKWLVTNESTGIYFYGGKYYNKNFVFEKSLSIKFPVVAGESWQKINYSSYSSDSTFKVSDTVTISCVSVSEKFQTDAGNLDCYVYHYPSNSLYGPSDTYIYYAVNVGYVGLIMKYNGQVVYKKKMTNYSLQKFNQQNTTSKSKSTNKNYYNEFN